MFDFLRADLFFWGGGGGIWPCDANTMRRLKKKNDKKKTTLCFPSRLRTEIPLSESHPLNPLVHSDVIMSKSQCGTTFSAV